MHFYKVLININGKISLQIYYDEILEKVISLWLLNSNVFVLEEDRDLRYGGGNSKWKNIIKEWKTTYRLKHYFNCPGSLDLSLIFKLLKGCKVVYLC